MEINNLEFEGVINNVKVFSKALSPKEIYVLYLQDKYKEVIKQIVFGMFWFMVGLGVGFKFGLVLLK